MLAFVEIQWWHWATFIFAVLIFLAFDLGVLHREARAIRFREALAWTCFLFVMALTFAATLVPVRGKQEALEFLTGYLIELSLSMDNVFVIAVIFGYFKVPLEYQHRVLFWGILGALVMRGLMIWLGSELVAAYHWTLYIFGIFLVITGIKMLLGDDESIEPERNPVLKFARRHFRFSARFDGQKFLTWENGRRVFTPLALVLLMVETCDLVFALDSIPAIFAVTTKPFIIFTSNVFAILGLRSLYFVLAGAIGYFCYLKYGLSIVLVFIGFKMLVMDWIKIPISLSLGLVVAIISGSILWSVVDARRRLSRSSLPGGTEPPTTDPG
jgi:tellurite resistance protein TerC